MTCCSAAARSWTSAGAYTLDALREAALSFRVRTAALLNISAVGLTASDAGTLAVGVPADIAVFTVEEGDFTVNDSRRRQRPAQQRLVNDATYVAGRLLPPRLSDAPKPWIPLTAAQQDALRRRARHVRELLRAPLVDVDGLAEQFPRN